MERNFIGELEQLVSKAKYTETFILKAIEERENIKSQKLDLTSQGLLISLIENIKEDHVNTLKAVSTDIYDVLHEMIRKYDK